jgi:hypothetical protein
MIGIAVYVIYAAAQNRRLSRISHQLNILLDMKQYEIEKAEGTENFDEPPADM